MFTLTPPLASLAAYPSIGESVLFQLNGFLVVMLALSSIWGVVTLIGRVFIRRAAVMEAALRSAAVESAAALAALPAAGANGTLPPATVAVIVAAVHTVLGHRVRLHAIKPAEPTVDWAREGRREIFASHKLR